MLGSFPRSYPIARFALWFLAALAAVLQLAGGGGIGRNQAALRSLRDRLAPSVLSSTAALNDRCERARGAYAAGQYPQVVETLLEVWLAAPDASLRAADCSAAVVELAASLQRLGQTEEIEKVYRRAIQSNPGARTWVAHFAHLGVSNAELERGSRSAALHHAVLAYDSAVWVEMEAEYTYEERAWHQIESTLDGLETQAEVMHMLAGSHAWLETIEESAGWFVLVGILQEKAGACQEAIDAYTLAQSLAPHARCLAKRLVDLRSQLRSCSP